MTPASTSASRDPKRSTTANPQDVVAVEAIPKNKSGKILRRVLKARYLGVDAGDISTMEDGP